VDHVEEHTRRASSFGSQADAYARYRPDYPVALLEWGLAPLEAAGTARVLDLAAGTGKLTEGLLRLGLDVIAVEPDTAMLTELTSRYPDVTAKPGAAEAIPLDDAAVDAVFVGQALHWFDLDRALPEIARVLRPGGVFVAAWNTYDDTVPWVAEFCALSDSVMRTRANNQPFDLGPLGAVEEATFPHHTRQSADSLVNTVGTQSHMLVSPPDVRDVVLARIRAYLLATPETAHGEFDVPMRTLGLRVRT
jgi:SAM-dependent methyltransferase